MSAAQPVVCVFCASSTLVAQSYFDAAENLAKELINSGYAIKYGGGAVGLMGAVANQALAMQGRVIGIIPQFMVDVEWQHPHVEEMHVVETMHQRKQQLIDNVDAVVALPGSSGTLEELIEVISMKKLGLFTKPVVIVNTNGFYDSLIDLFKRMADERFLHEAHLDTFTVINHPHEIVDAIRQSPQWRDDAITFATL